MEANTIISEATEIAIACQLDEITEDIGTHGIDESSFSQFKPLLNTALTLLFDIYHHNVSIFSSLDYPKQINEFHVNFIALLCEQSVEKSMFQTEQKSLLDNVMQLINSDIIKKMIQDNAELKEQLFKYYQTKLSAKSYKRNYGALIGFRQFCRLLFVRYSSTFQIDKNVAAFILSVGTLLIDNFEPEIQLIGIHLYEVLLHQTNKSILRDSNYHIVAYDNLFKLIHKCKEPGFVKCLWDCLFKFIDIEEEFKTNFTKWSKYDDLMDVLIDCLSLEYGSLSQIYLFQLIRFASNKMQGVEIKSMEEMIRQADGNSSIINDEVNLIRGLCEKQKNFQIYRWVKRIMKCVHIEITKVSGNSIEAKVHLNQIHICYLLCVYAVDINLIDDLLVNFLSNLTQALAMLRSSKTRTVREAFMHSIFIHSKLSGELNSSANKKKLSEFVEVVEHILLTFQ